MRRTLGPLLLCCTLLAGPAIALAADWYVAPDGKADAEGTRRAPLDLKTATGPRSPAQPGDTVWLADGQYAMHINSALQGEDGRPITVRPLPGARATLVSAAGQKSALIVGGAWTVWRDVEVTCTMRDRKARERGYYPGDYNRPTGIAVRGTQNTLAGCVVHDCGTGITALTESDTANILGCIVYNNGWQGPLVGHGNGIRSQNEQGSKRIADNVVFNQFGYGIHVFTDISQISRYEIEGNVVFDNGSLAKEGIRTPNLFVGSLTAAGRGIVVRDNHLWHGNRQATACQLGMGLRNNDLVVTGNTFVGLTRIMGWRKLEARDNRFVCRGTALEFHLPKTAKPSLAWDRNAYWVAPSDWSPFALYTTSAGGGLDWDGWRRHTTFDAASSFRAGTPQKNRVVVRPTPYVHGRGTIVVYNWAKKPSVAVDLSAVLSPGTRYRILSPLDIYGKPVLEGAFDGKPIQLPITTRHGPTVVGKSPAPPPVVGPELAVFLVRPVEEDPEAPPVEVKVEPEEATKEQQ